MNFAVAKAGVADTYYNTLEEAETTAKRRTQTTGKQHEVWKVVCYYVPGEPARIVK